MSNQLTLAGSGPLGYVDKVHNGRIIGWAVDPTTSPARFFLFIDDEMVGSLVCDTSRRDVESMLGLDFQTGFEILAPDRFFDGRPHRIHARFPNGAYLNVMASNGTQTQYLTAVFTRVPDMVSNIDGIDSLNGTICGWAAQRHPGETLARGGLELEIHSQGVLLARIRADTFRPDAARAVNADPNCGFRFLPPQRLRDGRPYVLDITLAGTDQPINGSPFTFRSPRALNETRLASLANLADDLNTQLFRLRREIADLLSARALTLDDYDDWARQYQHALRVRQRQAPWPAGLPRPLVSVICPVYRPALPDLRAAIDSVLAQTWPELELILVDDHSASPELTALLEDYAARDPRIRLIVQPANTGISGATNTAIAAARGAFVAFFDHDDLLLDVALDVMMDAARRTGARLLYSDEDKVDARGRFSEPNLKPAWNHRLLLGQNYVCHFLVVEAGTLRDAGPLRRKYDGAQDHDLVLRLAERVPEAEIRHVPEIVYHWRKTPGSTAVTIGAKSYAVKAGAAAVRDHLKRRGFNVRVAPMLGVTTYRVDWRFDVEPLVTVVIPFKDQAGITSSCLAALRAVTSYANLDIVLVDNWSTTPEAARLCAEAARHPRTTVRRAEEPFNYSRLNNLACAPVRSGFFVFMNNDVVVTEPDWLRRMVDEALADPAVAAVGARLLYPGGGTQHGGVVLGVDGIGDHAYRGRPAMDPHYAGRGICEQEVSAVTAALMLCRAEAFHQVGGFDEATLPVAYNDVDLCLKLRAAGFRIIQCQSVQAEHHESLSRGDDMDPTSLSRFIYEQGVMFDRWGPQLAADPFYNPNFSREGGIFNDLAPPATDPAPRDRANRPDPPVTPSPPGPAA